MIVVVPDNPYARPRFYRRRRYPAFYGMGDASPIDSTPVTALAVVGILALFAGLYVWSEHDHKKNLAGLHAGLKDHGF